MKNSVKYYLTLILITSSLLLSYSAMEILHKGVSSNFVYLSVALIVLFIFVNQKITEDVDTKTALIVVAPLLLPSFIFLPKLFVCLIIIISYMFIYHERPLIKRLFNISTSIISAVITMVLYESINMDLNIINSGEAIFIVILFLVALSFNLVNNILVYCIISLERGLWNKSSLIPFLILSKSTLVNILLGIINVYVYFYFGIIGLIISCFIIFAAKPLLYHYIKQNNDLTSHTKLILTLLKHKDPNTYEHSNRVTHWTMLIARKLNMSETEASQLSQASSWHDIGKIEISSEILNCDGKLSDEEYGEIQKHPELGYNMVKDLAFFKKFLDVIRYHHEKIDGTGYPLGLKGKEIPYHARIVCVADSFDAMTMDRPYREGMPMAEAVEELIKCSDTHFDSKVVKVFVEALKEEYGENYERWCKDSFVTA